MARSSDTSMQPGRVGARLAQYGMWVACCLSRGRRAPLGEGDIDQLVAAFGEMRFAGGTNIFCQGDEAAQIHVVRTGTIELSRVISGRRVALQILQPGDVFGDVPAFLDEPEPFDARALEDCVILSLDASSLFLLLQTRPQAARRWMVSLSERMAGLQHRLGDLLAGSLEAQLVTSARRAGGAEPSPLRPRQHPRLGADACGASGPASGRVQGVRPRRVVARAS